MPEPIPKNPLDAIAKNPSLRTFILSVALTVGVCVAGAFLGIALRGRTIIQEEMLNRARIDFQTLVHIRAWNASYGGVYVEKKEGVASNPFLENPDIKGRDGKTYTKKNPALMARELSERLQRSEGYGFHLTSLNPLNPANKADPEEAIALRAFEQGATERFWTETVQGRPYTRYMAPLRVEASCLECHAKQGYRVGDVRGGISFYYESEGIQARLHTNLLLVGGLALVTAGMLIGLVMVFFGQLVRKLSKARHKLETIASTDHLTGLFNRRHIIQRIEEECERAERGGDLFSCILFDADHFKAVNDTYGHLKGDEVLKAIAAQARHSLRTYDVVGRHGGEEFIALLPGADLETATGAAERLRQAVEGLDLIRTPDGERQPVTISLGVTRWQAGDSEDSLVHRADLALYRAKAAGRNRVEVAGSEEGAG